MNCTFIAAEVGEHTLEAIGEMMKITREGVRVIEKRAMNKIRAALSQKDSHADKPAAGHKSPRSAGKDSVPSFDEGLEPEDEPCDVSVGNDRVMAGG